MEAKETTIYRHLKILFISSLILCTALFTAVFYLTTGKYNPAEPDVELERYAIPVTLIAIPVALKLFYDRTKSMDKTDFARYLKKYRRLYYLRTAILAAAYLFNLISLYITGAKNFSFMIIITIFALALCAPQKVHLEQDKR
jgi:hypothetical protein